MVHSRFFIIKFAAGGIHGDLDILPRHISGSLDRLHKEIQHALRIRQIGCKAALIPDSGGQAFLLQQFFQIMINFRTDP